MASFITWKAGGQQESGSNHGPLQRFVCLKPNPGHCFVLVKVRLLDKVPKADLHAG
jgi:hypothetical protein